MSFIEHTQNLFTAKSFKSQPAAACEEIDFDFSDQHDVTPIGQSEANKKVFLTVGGFDQTISVSKKTSGAETA